MPLKNKAAGLPRNACLDALRGWAAISIVLIHTTFYSGSQYLPYPVAIVSLLFDVPLFFFLSGMLRSMKGESIGGAILKFITVFGLAALLWDLGVLLATGAAPLLFNNAMRALTLNAPNFQFLPVLTNSYWFVPVYVAEVYP